MNDAITVALVLHERSKRIRDVITYIFRQALVDASGALDDLDLPLKAMSRALLSRVQIACTTDDLSRDTLTNQIIKATLAKMAKTAGIDAGLRDGIAAALSALSDVRAIPLSARDFGRVQQLHGNNAFYGFLLRVCALAYEALLREPGTGRFRDVLGDSTTMGLIFQDFVRNFFAIAQNHFKVKVDQIRWPVDTTVGFGDHLTPSMYTDASLYDGTRTIIIECKWTPETFQIRRGTKTLRSSHLYQLHAYMTQHARTLSGSGTVEGLLLYPLADEPVDVALNLKGQLIRVRTLDLAASWPEVHHQMLSLLCDATPLPPIQRKGEQLLAAGLEESAAPPIADQSGGAVDVC